MTRIQKGRCSESPGLRWIGDDYTMFERFQKEQAHRWWSV